MMLHVPTRRVARTIVAAALAVAMVPGLVAAHADLLSSVPADKATVPSTFAGPIVLTFSEHLATGSKADLIGPDGSTVAAATVDPAAMTMTFSLTSPLSPGAYEVRWVSIADDGDLLRLPVVTFTVAAAPSPSPTPVATAAPSAAPTQAAVSAAPSTGPTPAPSLAGTPADSTGDVLLPIIVALVILVAGATYLLSRRSRPTDRA
jgi:methionine-rich copper-binding protein CopC